MNTGPPTDPRGPPPPPQPPYMPPMPPHLVGFAAQPPSSQQPRIDPRLAAGGIKDPRVSAAGSAAPPPPLPPVAPPVRPPVPPGAGAVSSADAISAVLATMTPQNVFDIISSMKILAANEPDRATGLLAANPQLSYALFQAMLMMNMVDPMSLQRMFPPAAGAAPTSGIAPPPPQMPLAPPVPPQVAPQVPQMMLEQQQQLLKQVMALTPADIASLPEDQRANILQLRAQLMGPQ
ncbi:hypothetical protein BGZ83_010032 [Gryganskiella cystojenkinii]|nr:hypothetical protein BGZ83_010032 [Gryganskiella cystojenkinii]